ncbi:MAG: F0F1 ATP synthase subunit A [Verrucomicrobiae bacterium]|nr:F0F1 ATP synthase subunit A [Verrucomicrobiae bacterium]
MTAFVCADRRKSCSIGRGRDSLSLNLRNPMRLLVICIAALWYCWTGLGGDPTAESHGSAEAGLPQSAVRIFGEHSFLTNSLLLTWLVSAGLVLAVRIGLRRTELVPSGAQNFWEALIEGLYEFLAGIIGHDLAKRTFWFFATIFIFILAANWSGLIPGVGTIGWGVPDANGRIHHITRPLLRGANADLNLTFGMAMMFFVLWFYWGIRANGLKGFFLHIFGPKGETKGLLGIVLVFIFLGVGIIEAITILFRPVTLSFRLYGNIFAGENLLEAMARLIQEPPWLRAIASVLIPVPFYLLELVVGLVQAMVFMLLTAVFTLLICTHDEEKHDSLREPS